MDQVVNDIVRSIDALFGRTTNTATAPFASWSTLELKRTSIARDDHAKRQNDAIRTENFDKLIQFVRQLIKDNKVVPDYTKAWKPGTGTLAGDAHSVQDLQEILHDTFQLPENQVKQLICDLGILERGALLHMKHMVDENLKTTCATPPSLFTASELNSQRRNWHYTTFKSVGHINSERLEKIHREIQAFITNCANDPKLTRHLGRNLVGLALEEKQAMLRRLEQHLSAAVNYPCKINFDSTISGYGETGSNGKWSDIRLAPYLQAQANGLRSIILVLCHEGFHASQFKEIQSFGKTFGLQRTIVDCLDHNDARSSYQKLMLVISTVPYTNYRSYRQGKEVEREGYAAGMAGILYFSQNDRLNPQGMHLFNKIDFRGQLHLARGEDAVALVRAVLEKKIGFTMHEYCMAASGKPLPSPATPKSVLAAPVARLHAKQELEPQAKDRAPARLQARISTSHAERLNHGRFAGESSVEARIYRSLLTLGRQIGDEIREDLIQRAWVLDALLMGAPALCFDDSSPDAVFLMNTLESGLRAASPEQFLDSMLTLCEQIAPQTVGMKQKLDNIKKHFPSPLSQYILNKLLDFIKPNPA